MAEEFIPPTPKIEEIHLVGQTVEGFDIIADALCLRRELTDEISGKCLAAFRYPVGMSVREIGDAVDTVVIDVAQTDAVEDTQIATDLIDRATWAQATEDMHACLKTDATTGESLKTTSDDGILLENRHSVAFFCQQGTCKKASQPTSYDDDRLSIHWHL